MDPKERLLEHALYEELGGDGADAPDLAPAIRAAWERSVEQRPEPEPKHRTKHRPEQRPPSFNTARPWWLPLTAAAALAVIGGGVWWMNTPSVEPQEAPPEEIAQEDPSTTQPAVPTASQLARASLLQGALGDLRGAELAPGMLRDLIATYDKEGPLAELRAAPELWPLVAPTMEQILEPQALPPFARGELLDVLALDLSPEAERLLRAAWLQDPESFSMDAIVVLAERGLFEFEREATAWLGMLDDVSGDPFALALWGALRGDERGGAILEAALTAGRNEKEPERPLLAAAGLAKLGRGTAWLDTWEPYKAKLRGQLEGAELGADELGEVARAVDALAYAWTLHDEDVLPVVGPSDGWDGVPRAGQFRHWLDLYYVAQAVRVRTRDSLAEELAALEER